MKVVILAGGRGTRLMEETIIRPKPLVEIGGRPILWHIMKIFATHGFTEFAIALGYKGEMIKRFFLDYFYLKNSFSIRLSDGHIAVKNGPREDWTVHLVDTGLETQTGGRIKRLADWIGNERFILTYGDGVANVDVQQLLDFHIREGRLATVTAVRPPARFGALDIEGGGVRQFNEKPQAGEGWINGGFFVLEPEVMEYIGGDESVFERDPLDRIAREEGLSAYRHEGFWMCMDTLRDVQLLERLWEEGTAPWKIWGES